ncbi:SDR family NAD(P)-dependent oxidoreductase [Streptomyces sp. NPDC060054]|uniref:SDR family NAD(P)-dependent oxidoreductase n=1 Tax=Streptomyces sp. NPDC060054 TaxID=3347048 RepID=UPI00367F6DFB
MAGRRADNGYGVYNLTEFGVNGFTKSLRQKLTQHHVRVGVIERGGIATELGSHNRSEVHDSTFNCEVPETCRFDARRRLAAAVLQFGPSDSSRPVIAAISISGPLAPCPGLRSGPRGGGHGCAALLGHSNGVCLDPGAPWKGTWARAAENVCHFRFTPHGTLVTRYSWRRTAVKTE